MTEEIAELLEGKKKASLPRLLIAAGKSGAGKTMITCGFLEVLKKRGLGITAYKCGPDYIDPMFHREVLGVPSYNLDTFLCGRENVREILIRHSMPGGNVREMLTCHSISGENALDGRGAIRQIAVIEGVMGYYDGLGGISCEASTYDVADITDTPSVLVVDCKGTSVSLIPYIQGFLNYRNERVKDSHIKGVILNRISPMMYKRVKELIETETSARVYGYVPEIKDFVLESRYLGLKLPGEINEIKEKLKKLGDLLEESLDIDGLLELASSAPPLTSSLEPSPMLLSAPLLAPLSSVPLEMNENEGCENTENRSKEDGLLQERKGSDQNKLRIGVAMDEAFCFIYQDNLDILRSMGARIIPFSPLHDEKLPENLDGVIFYGGYPELYAKKLSENESMRVQVKQALLGGLPCIAECGGFMYLTEGIRDESGSVFPMCGVFRGESFHTPKLRRFGYVTLSGGKVFGKDAGDISSHEFHYYDSEQCGEAFEVKKPVSARSWRCMVSTETILAGYPHIHYAGSPGVAEAFLQACRKHSVMKEGLE